ncbi:MAG TPA: response regulator [Deltaproteobacteria bacterium]|nr:response regulator [Deltaproteobacteria bacterium]
MRILIVDDQEYSRYLLETILKASGHEVTAAVNGLDALEKMERAGFDLVISDILMPVMDGYTLCRRCRADERFRDILFVFYTGTYTDERDEALAYSLGADLFLRKPLSPNELVAKLEGLLSAGRSGPAPTSPGEVDGGVLELYNERLVRKLEGKMQELEEERGRRNAILLEVQRKNRSLRMIKECMSALMHSREEQDLFSSIARVVVDSGGFSVCWIGMVGPDGLVHPEASWCRLPGVEFRVPQACLGQGYEACPIAECMRSGKIAVRTPPWDGLCRDVSLNSVKFGYVGEMAVPLVVQGRPIGVMLLYVPEQAALDEEDVSLLSGLAEDMAVHVVSLRNERERLAAETLLARSEERFRIMAETNPDTIFLLAREGLVEYLSPAAGRLFGRPVTELTGMRFTDFFDGDDALDAVRAFDEVCSGATVRNRELVISLPGGGKSFIEISAAPLVKEGVVEGVLGVARDIGRRKEIESQLLASQKMEVLGSMAAGIAHDFNNILSAIVGYAELMLEKAGSDAAGSKDLAAILDASMKARDLVRGLLNLSRLTPEKPTALRPAEVIRETMRLMRSCVHANIEIALNARSTTRILSDPARLHQMVLNLVVNAAAAIGSRPGRITIDVEDTQAPAGVQGTAAAPRTYVKVSVSDTGCGIAPEILPDIFKPFFSTRHDRGGTGLGLFMVKTLVEEHGGFVEVNSVVGSGTRFDLLFPAFEGEGEGVQAESEEESPRGSGRILFVDDEQSIAVIAHEMLSGLGYQVTSVSSGIEALDLFGKDPTGYDLVVTDVAMPVMTGVDLAREVLKIRPGMPVILCSGTHDGLLETEAEALGVRAFLLKPFKRLDLARVS